MLSVVFSNRHEVLLEVLLQRLAEERPGPFAQREVVVPGSAMRRSIELAVAGREGVCADLRFDYLAQWLWRQIGRVVEVGERSPFSPALLTWRIYAELGEEGAGWAAPHERLATYLGAADARMRLELAARIARVFDHYLTYRPRWLAAWSDGRSALDGLPASAVHRADEAWQGALWRRLQASMALRREHPAATFLQRIAAMNPAELAAIGLPRSVHVFALPALPPLYLDMLRELSRVVEVQLYVLNPCREYWFEIVDARRLSWLARGQRELFHETGNALLAAWGRQTQAHIDLLFEGERATVDCAAFVAHPGDHLLAHVHNAILDLVELEAGSVTLGDDDRSIEVHVCHARSRELEVLHDRLLGLFAADPTLRPQDVVVLTPDLDGCAAQIEAVFGSTDAARRIPWRITGLPASGDNAVARVIDALLALVGGRFPVSALFDLLQREPVAARFGVDADALECIHDWLQAAGARWGLSAADAAAAGPYSMEEALHRLFLAWAAGPAAQAATFAGHLGAAAPAGQEAEHLGRLWRYADTLRRLRPQLLQAHSVADWQRLLNAALDALVDGGPRWAAELREVRGAIAELCATIAEAGVTTALPLAVLHPALLEALDAPARGGVPGGAVTFSAISALRGLPYRVVCVIGLDRGAFPAVERAAEFDLLAAFPQRGDRQRRNDDRNLFLDVVLAARDVLHLSYVGRSVRDAAVLPPAVLVDELLDVLAAATAVSPAQPEALAAARRRLIVEHPLQAFSPSYFLAAARPDPRLQSYHAEYAQALAARLAAPVPATALAAVAGEDEGGAALDEGDDDDEAVSAAVAAPFFSFPLPPPAAPWRTLDVDRLVRFFRHPCRYLLRERLGVALPESAGVLADVEPFLPDFAGRRALAGRLLAVLADPALSADDDGLLALARAGGEYPPGTIGDDALRAELALLRDFAAAQRPWLGVPSTASTTLELAWTLEDGEVWTLRDSIALPPPGLGLLQARYDDTRATDYLAAWLRHLALCAALPAGTALPCTGLSRNGRFALRAVPPQEAAAHLRTLVHTYRAGLMEPAHFFPRSAWAYVLGGNNANAARRCWLGGREAHHGEGADVANRLALRGVAEPLDGRFFSLAEALLAPLRAQLDDERVDR